MVYGRTFLTLRDPWSGEAILKKLRVDDDQTCQIDQDNNKPHGGERGSPTLAYINIGSIFIGIMSKFLFSCSSFISLGFYCSGYCSPCASSTAWFWNGASSARSVSTSPTSSRTAICEYASLSCTCSSLNTMKCL